MWNKTKKYYHELKTLESIPVKVSKNQKFISGLFFILFLSSALCVTYYIRPYIYDHKLYHYYDIIGSLPSFISVPACYFFFIFILKVRNRCFNTGNYLIFLIVMLIANLFYELIMSNTFDWMDIVAIFLGLLPVVVIEKLFPIFNAR